MARGLRWSVIQHLLTQAAVHAIGAHQRIAFDQLLRLVSHRHHAVGFTIAFYGLGEIQMHIGIIAQCGQQQLVQIGAMDGHIGRAIALHGRAAQWHARQGLARQGAAHLQGLGHGRHRLQAFLQPPGLQPTHHIRAQLYSGTDFGEISGTFEQTHITAGACGANTRGQSADSATGNQHLLFHAPIVPSLSRVERQLAYCIKTFQTRVAYPCKQLLCKRNPMPDFSAN
ncbi:hypothetical protein D3C71_1532010 [compost metagenome]